MNEFSTSEQELKKQNTFYRIFKLLVSVLMNVWRFRQSGDININNNMDALNKGIHDLIFFIQSLKSTPMKRKMVIYKIHITRKVRGKKEEICISRVSCRITLACSALYDHATIESHSVSKVPQIGLYETC